VTTRYNRGKKPRQLVEICLKSRHKIL